ncbi:MAG: chorismate mutase [Rickettsiales bacterium]|nr:chorismate mutase [Rickettsiales bacterium]
MSKSAQLTEFRKQIDAIDDEIIALMKQRIEIVAQVGAAKKAAGEKGLFLRSGREGKMIRRIFNAFKSSNFDATAATSMWRQMIAASIHHESPMQLSVVHHEKIQNLLWLAREHFGSFVPVTTNTTVNGVLGDLASDKINIGILPSPAETFLADEDTNWWLVLASQGNTNLKIFAHLPVVAHPEFPKRACHGLAIANVTPEESGNDESYFACKLQEAVSTSKATEIFAKSGITASLINSSNQPPVHRMLIKLDGFYTDDSDELLEVSRALGDAEIIWLGSHPKPIDV